MKYVIRISLCLIICFHSCKNESEKKLDKFKEVNDSLKELNKDTTFATIYSRIAEKRNKNLLLFHIVDSLKDKLEAAGNFLDSLIDAIEKIDTTGERTDVVSRNLIGTRTGAALTEKTHSVYMYTIEKSAYQSSKEKIESFFTKYHGLFGTKEFLHLIDKIPTVSVATILRGVKTDCTRAAIICSRDIEVRLE